MHPIIEGILERPKGQKIAIWVGTIALLTFGYWQYFYSSKAEEIAKVEEKISDFEKKIADEKRRTVSLPRLREMVKDLDAKLKAVLLELPDNSSIDQLIDSISDKARDAGLEITLFNRKEDVVKDFYAEVPVSVNVEGTYHQVATFFDEVSRLDRIVNINQIVVQTPTVGDEQVTVKVECVATTFRYLSEEERARVTAAEEDKGSGGRRRK